MKPGAWWAWWDGSVPQGGRLRRAGTGRPPTGLANPRGHRGRRGAALLVAGVLATVQAPAPAQEAAAPRLPGTPELMRSLAQGGFVIYFRHGHTHWQQKLIEQAMQAEGRLDLDNCATQRNLDAVGRADAQRIHGALRTAGIPVGKVLSSLYCRPAQYVELITGRKPVRTRWLTGLSTPATLLEIRREVATPPEPGMNTFLGGHGDRPFDLTGLVIQEGDALVFDPRQQRRDDPGKFKPLAWIKPAEWAALAGADAAPMPSPASSSTSSPAPVPAPAPQGFRLQQVEVAAAPFHDEANVRTSLPMLVPGGELDDAALSRAVQLARENPARNIEVLLRAAASGDGLDADVAVASVKPWTLSIGFTHASEHRTAGGTGLDRLWLAAQHANLWNLDHQASLQVSRAAGATQGNASLGYALPWPAQGVMWGAALTRAHEGAGLDANLQPITGAGRMLTLFARQHLAPRGDYHHQVEVSWSDRLWYGLAQARLRSRPLQIAYAAHWEQEWIGWKAGASWAVNLPGGSDNDAANYVVATGDGQASPRWNALRLDAEWLRILTYDIRLRLSARGQWSNRTLPSGEQFALGGALRPWGSAFGVWPRGPWLATEGVRGLPERSALGDSGALLSAELWSRRLFGQDLRVGSFFDAGTMRRHSSAALGNTDPNARSLGLLSHYQWRGQVALGASAAQVLRGAGVVSDQSRRVDVTLAWRY